MKPQLGENTALKRPTLSFLGAFLTLFLLSGFALAQDSDKGELGLPAGCSTYADKVDYLYIVIFWVTTGMFILTEGLLVVFCILYRRRPGHRPSYTHGNNTAEITWTIVPAVMLLGLAVWQIPTWNSIKAEFPDPKKEEHVTETRAFAEQYAWNFMWPGTKGKIEGADDNDISTVGQLHVPFGEKVLVHLRSKDVIHSFFIPSMRVKQDTVPGLRNKVWFQPNRFQLVKLKEAPHQEGEAVNDTLDPIPRMVQPFEWVNLDPDNLDPKKPWNPDKQFKEGGKYYGETIALNNYSVKGGMYQPLNPKSKIRVLYKGKVEEGRSWEDCTRAIGIFEIACAELCGLGHYKMRAQLTVEPRAAYEAWLKDQTDNVLADIWKKKLWRD
jgi:cytochrome c oxidase subunit 2